MQPVEIRVPQILVSYPTEIEDFDTFFGNFLDVGFPNCANDQLLLELDMPDFEFVPHGLA